MLEVHSDQIGSFEQSDRLQSAERHVGTIDRAACVLFEELYGDRRERELACRIDLRHLRGCMVESLVYWELR